MRNFVLVAIALGLASANARAQTSAPEGLACFENPPTPEYPRSALQTHVDGSVWTWTQVNSQGVPDKVETEVVSAWSDAPKLLTPAVENAIHAAKFKSDCAGKRVWVVFRYQLQGEATAKPKVTSRTDGPNVMWIESQPAAGAAISRATPRP
jgi:hypothetical protein